MLFQRRPHDLSLNRRDDGLLGMRQYALIIEAVQPSGILCHQVCKAGDDCDVGLCSLYLSSLGLALHRANRLLKRLAFLPDLGRGTWCTNNNTAKLRGSCVFV